MESLTALAKETGLAIESVEFAQYLDSKDALAKYRSEFAIPPMSQVSADKSEVAASKASTYLCGNSLGLMPLRSRGYVNQELEIWSNRGVEGHWNHAYNRPWATIDENVVSKMATVVGAKPIEVAVMNTLTGNLHLLLASFYTPTSTRYKIIMEAKAFPSDHYAIESQIRWHGRDPKDALILVAPREGEHYLRTEDILEVIGQEGKQVATVIFSGVQYYTGQYFEMEKITKAGQAKGCIVGWDLAHAAGNVPVQLHDWNIDFACWCSYKYLNSGPGGIAAIFVHEKHAHDFDRPRLSGWWGHQKSTRFQMTNVFEPTPGAYGFQLSNPSVLNTVCLMGSLEIFTEATMPALRAKSLQLTGYLEYLIDQTIDKAHVKIITPRDPNQRGCQLSLLFSNGKMEQIFDILGQKGVVCDDRKPDCIRIAPTPLYNTFSDVHRAVQVLKQAIQRVYA